MQHLAGIWGNHKKSHDHSTGRSPSKGLLIKKPRMRCQSNETVRSNTTTAAITRAIANMLQQYVSINALCWANACLTPEIEK